MLGPPKPRRLNDPITVSLEGLVPQDNVYRHFEVELGLGFVREGARDLSAGQGRPSIDPAIGWSRRRGLGGPSMAISWRQGRQERQRCGLGSTAAYPGRFGDGDYARP